MKRCGKVGDLLSVDLLSAKFSYTFAMIQDGASVKIKDFRRYLCKHHATKYTKKTANKVRELR